jgi:hypothetical protein
MTALVRSASPTNVRQRFRISVTSDGSVDKKPRHAFALLMIAARG